MPVKMDDLKQHIHSNNSLRDSIDAALEGIVARVQSIDSAAGVSDAVNDIRQNKASLIEAIFANISGTHTRLGAGETAKIPADNGELAPGYRADDPRANADVAESQGNPALPRDASGHKVHPADALGGGASDGRTDPVRANSIGGDGKGIDALHVGGMQIRDTAPVEKTPGQIAAEARIAARTKANAGQANGPHD